MEIHDANYQTVAAEIDDKGLIYTIVLLRDDQVERIAQRVVELLREQGALAKRTVR
jgi:hypothetical protein